jgi:hypothetical protein
MFTASGVAAQQVDVALSLLLDSSGSVSSTEFNLQKSGYVDAFQNPAIWSAISSGSIGSIAVSFSYWSSRTQFDQAVGWTVIDSESAMNDFAGAIDATTRPFGGGTALGQAIKEGADDFGQLAGLGITATRWVMDISGDGCNNERLLGEPFSETAASDARAYAVAAGVDDINGLVIQPGNSCLGFAPESTVLDHYQAQVATAGGFVDVASDFDAFGDAIDDKIIREVTVTTPEPASAALLLVGMLGVGIAGRRRRGIENEDE